MRIIKRCILFIFCGAVLLACRKKIGHNSGKEGNIYSLWTQYNDIDIKNVRTHTLEVYNNELYIGAVGYGIGVGNGWNPTCLLKMDSTGNVVPLFSPNLMEATNSSGYPIVLDMQVYDDELYVGGTFKLNETGQDTYGLFKYDASMNVVSFDFFGSGPVKSLDTLNGDLMILRGPIETGGWGNVFVHSSGGVGATEVFQSPGVSIMDGCVSGNDFIVVGFDIFVQRAAPPFSTWQPTIVNGINSSTNIESIVRFGNFEYITTEYENMIFAHDLNTGVWSQLSLPSNYTHSSLGFASNYHTRFKIVDNELYLLAKGVHKLNGQEWITIGNLDVEVYDLIKFNGNLFAATRFGLFESP